MHKITKFLIIILIQWYGVGVYYNYCRILMISLSAIKEANPL